MNRELPERDLLRIIDPAPHPRTAEQQERHLRDVRARLRSDRPTRSTRLPRAALFPLLAGAAAAALAAVLLLPALAPSAPGPAAGSTAQHPVALTIGDVTRSGVRILARTEVGDAVFLLGSRDDDIRLAVAFDGTDPDRNWERVTPRPAMRPTDVRLFSAANYPDAAPGGIAQAAGYAGTDITSLDIHTHDGTTRHATVTDGYWLAAWNGHDFTDTDTDPTGLTIHHRDGTTTSQSFHELSGW